jgi:hypothetical protein
MTQEEVVALMSGSKSEKEWNDNCDKVKAAERAKGEDREYPDWWYGAIIRSGLLGKVRSSWK